MEGANFAMNIIIVDDDALICKSLSIMLEKEPDIHVLGTANNGAQALEMCEKYMPDLILMDIRMPEVDGIQATHRIKKEFPNIKIVMLTTFQDKPNIEMALKAGAEGYLLKTDRIANLVPKLRIMSQGVSVMDSEVLKTLTAPKSSPLENLTPRERDVTILVTQGFTNREIAERLFLSEGTVRNILSTIMSKLKVKNRMQLIVRIAPPF